MVKKQKKKGKKKKTCYCRFKTHGAAELVYKLSLQLHGLFWEGD